MSFIDSEDRELKNKLTEKLDKVKKAKSTSEPEEEKPAPPQNVISLEQFKDRKKAVNG